MPIIKQAAKKMRHDKKVTKKNASKRRVFRDAVKDMRSSPSDKKLTHAYAIIDKSVKFHIIHKNRAARLKSRLSKLIKK